MNTITVRVVKEDDGFVSHCLDYDIASQGDTSQEALDNIKEAVSLFLEVASPQEVREVQEQQGQILRLSLGCA